MRKNLLVGVGLVVAAFLAVYVSAWFDLELEPVALLGLAVGAVVAVVPDRAPVWRVVGFLGGVAVTWIAYLLRAGVLPDSTFARALVFGLVIALAVGISLVSFGRVPMWSSLLGVGALVGAYEAAYTAAPPEVVSTSFSTVTALLFTIAVGFLAVSLVAPDGEAYVEPRRRRVRHDHNEANHRLEDMMEKSK